MARRRLNQQQQKRIQGAQDAITGIAENQIEGLVISHHGSRIIVEASTGQLIECRVKSNLGAIVCGDLVVCEHTGNDEYRLIATRPRDTLLQRVDGFGALKVVAANVTQLLICLAVKPEPNLFLLDQYLLSAEQQAIKPVIILNKIDLLPAATKDPYQLDTIYAPLGYQVICLSVKTGQGLERLKSLLDHQSSVLGGVSGVGKSSITSAILPEEIIKIAEISKANDEGRHTTRTSRLYHLPREGRLIDTPGVRGFNPAFDLSQSVSVGFKEIESLARECRFGDCRHTIEPKCAVLNALSQGEIVPSRYQHYLRMVEQLEAG